ncbi:hypothetical protein CFOL_v3_25638 [Cephalotus follicularis]|uniref:Uncharacterized protein n=1 Tax=Cephalotus follicularis TaxID=3775 RepID=A0A1Q3CPJ9_CEPFO|nr:hypothetical protein CFOL_v3_25638 [Cephalotus follicularis]
MGGGNGRYVKGQDPWLGEPHDFHEDVTISTSSSISNGQSESPIHFTATICWTWDGRRLLSRGGHRPTTADVSDSDDVVGSDGSNDSADPAGGCSDGVAVGTI